MIVPVVPIAETKCVTRPPVSRQISGPVVRSCMREVVGVGELVEDHVVAGRAIASARSREPSIVSSAGVRTTSAP
jgi:hypothetical protein